ncbi:hypothetical protein BDB00DRAFT_807932 [Zychaea mexicana]|uniref:uncharacterized protein n=1 Tax=Zychaea mexicana TaxID=64656 RepID=UPI0022FE753A|nr:uncharacterized protein BDB00DRAFT_807932 [Zychaea mexicana]KAI9496592.1 hypothetical protein BDB00DRAFT_807932 [Zychaea mexicana]
MRRQATHLKDASSILFPSKLASTRAKTIRDIPSCCWNSHIQAMLRAIDMPRSSVTTTTTQQQQSCRRRSVPLRRQYYNQTITTQQTRRFATAALSTRELQQQQQRVCSTTTSGGEKGGRRRDLAPQPADLQGPFSVFNLSHHVDFADLERTIRSKQAESAWSLFTTLASRRQDNKEEDDNPQSPRYIPLPLCSALYSLLTFAKTLSVSSKSAAYRQKQIDQLLRYVEEEFEMPRSQFMTGAQVIPVPGYKLLLRALRRNNRRTAWGIFSDMSAGEAAEIPRTYILKLMALVQDDFKVDSQERSRRLEFIAGLHEGQLDSQGRALTGLEMLQVAKVYYLFSTDDPRAAHGMMMQLANDNGGMSSSMLAELVWRAIEFNALGPAWELLHSVSKRRKEKARDNAVAVATTASTDWNDEQAYVSLIHAYRNRKQYNRALEMFERILQDGKPPSTWAFNAALQVFAEQGETDKAVFMYNSMIQLGVMPDVATLSEIIKVHTVAGDLRTALDYYHTMREKFSIQPNAYTYSLIIEAFSNRNDVRSVIRWFQSMVRHGVAPNRVVIGNVMKAFKQQSRRHPNLGEAVMRIAAHASAAGISADANLYTLLLQAQAQLNGLGGALATHREMVDRLVEPNVYTYTVLISVCGKYDAPDAAQRIFELMKQSRVYLPNTYTYCVMMDVWSRARRYDLLNDLVREFVTESNANEDGRLIIDAKVKGYIQLYT